jgi:hypothetical protein
MQLVDDRAAGSSDVPTGRVRASLILSIAVPVILAVVFAIRATAGLLVSPLALIGSVTGVMLAISARREITRLYDSGEEVFQPIEADLLRDRSASTWALGLTIPAIPFEVLFTLVLLFPF